MVGRQTKFAFEVLKKEIVNNIDDNFSGPNEKKDMVLMKKRFGLKYLIFLLP